MIKEPSKRKVPVDGGYLRYGKLVKNPILLKLSTRACRSWSVPEVGPIFSDHSQLNVVQTELRQR